MTWQQEIQSFKIRPPKRRVLVEKSLPGGRAIAEGILVPGGSLWLVRKSDCSIVRCQYVASKGREEVFHLERHGNFSINRESVWHADSRRDYAMYFGNESVSAYTSEKNAVEAVLDTHLPNLIEALNRTSSNKNISPEKRKRKRARVAELKRLFKRLAKSSSWEKNGVSRYLSWWSPKRESEG